MTLYQPFPSMSVTVQWEGRKASQNIITKLKEKQPARNEREADFTKCKMTWLECCRTASSPRNIPCCQTFHCVLESLWFSFFLFCLDCCPFKNLPPFLFVALPVSVPSFNQAGLPHTYSAVGSAGLWAYPDRWQPVPALVLYPSCSDDSGLAYVFSLPRHTNTSVCVCKVY